MPKIPLKISCFPLSVNLLFDKIAKLAEIVLPTSIHTLLISTPMETTNEPTKHVEKQRKSISLLVRFSINGSKIFVALCFWLWVEEPTFM